MAEFSVEVVEITSPVQHHPNADRLSLIQIGGYTCISAKLEDGSHRYGEGDLVAYLPEGAVLPEWLLKRLDLWKEDAGKGVCAGPKGDRVKAVRLRQIFSQGILLPVTKAGDGEHVRFTVPGETGDILVATGSAPVGRDIKDLLGVVKYEPPIPASMAGEVTSIHGKTLVYDVESIQKSPDAFVPGEEVVATEKLHGTNCQIGYVPGLDHPELFLDGCLYVGSKGLSAQGLVFKNNDANAGNVYVQVLKGLLDNGFGEAIRQIANDHGKSVHVVGEIFGVGVQDLTYGQTTRVFQVFDVAIGGAYVGVQRMREIAAELGLTTVPVLYEGPFNQQALEAVRDGKDSISGTSVREGIVIRSMDEERHPLHGRKSMKWVSPDYLLRKGNATEFS